ncbi:hypothetical protein ACQKNB_22310 [Lysinibacillus xylanilyticus]|uniref:hypothetical protein n=1 Tax=Lysinibacillus xylanilyticus TaxID=582475 RepID=UPI003D08FFC4
MGFTFAVDPLNSPCVKELLSQALQTNSSFSVLSPRYVIYVNSIIKKAAAFADATARIGLCPLCIASNMELRHTNITVEKTI